MKKKAVSILCMVAMSIGSLGTEVVCAAESDFVLAKDPEDYKLTIYWPAPDTYFEENIQPGYQAVEEKYGVSFDSSKGSQQISQSDFEFFDLIVGMDESNVEDLLQVSAGRYDDKIKLFRPGGVPDPWYTGDFDVTYNDVLEGCTALLKEIKKEL